MITELSKGDFQATFVEPMRRLGAEESYRPVPLGDYVEECIHHLALPTTRMEIEIHHVYVSGDEKHSHVLLHYGKNNEYLVVVVEHPSDIIKGYHLLNLNKEYGAET